MLEAPLWKLDTGATRKPAAFWEGVPHYLPFAALKRHWKRQQRFSLVRAGTAQAMCQGSQTISLEGHHVDRVPCQPGETVLPLRGTKGHCPCLSLISKNFSSPGNFLRR